LPLVIIETKDLRRLREYLRRIGVELKDGPHAVLPDSSEVVIIEGSHKGKKVSLVAHYIDNHYAALTRLPDSADDRSIAEALIQADAEERWESPVEPVIISTESEEIIPSLKEYRDDYPNEEVARLVREYQERDDALTSYLTKKIFSAGGPLKSVERDINAPSKEGAANTEKGQK